MSNDPVCSLSLPGIDRLCCLTQEGKLNFYIVGPRCWHVDDVDFGGGTGGGASLKANSSLGEESMELGSGSGGGGEAPPKSGEWACLLTM